MAKSTRETFILLVAGLVIAFLGATTPAPSIVTWLGLGVAGVAGVYWLVRSGGRRQPDHD
ncbi:MAG TPA: hypothetical protein VHO27_14095 [Angustibacter sp.]|nr:hypothetical protein [Angustibacter sp.]